MTGERAAAIADAALVVNAGSRSGRRGLAHALGAFERLGTRPREIVAVDDAKAVVDATERAVRDGRSLVIVGGGDGTATSVCGAFARSRAILGLLPLGTGNSFARSLGIPLDVAGAVRTIATGIPREIDLGLVDGVHFANYAAVGLSANVAGSTPARLKAFFGPAAYVAIGFALTRRHRAFRGRVFANDEGIPRYDGPTHQIVIANGRYFGTVPILPDATLDDGVLSTFAIAGAHRGGVIRFWLHVLGGADSRALPEGRWFSAERVRLETEPSRIIEIDGQAIGRTPATFSIERRAMRALVPPEATELRARA